MLILVFPQGLVYVGEGVVRAVSEVLDGSDVIFSSEAFPVGAGGLHRRHLCYVPTRITFPC